MSCRPVGASRLGIGLVGLSLLALAARPAAQSGNGSLKVTSFPSGARVAIDGTDTGKTTPMSISLTAGDHAVVVSIPDSGWTPDQRSVTIVEGNNDLSVTLLPMLTIGPAGPKGDKGDKGDPGAPGPPGAVTQAQFDALAARVAALESILNAGVPPAPIPPSQGGNDFACFGAPAPTIAVDPVAISGTTRRLSGIDQVPAPGILAEFHRRSDGTVLASGWSDDAGQFMLTITTGGVPVDGYVSFSGADLVPTRLYTSKVVAGDANLGSVLLAGLGTVQAFYQLVNVVWSPGQSSLIAMTRDCGAAPVANAVVSAVPAGNAPVYLSSTGFPTPSLTATTSSAIAWLLNQPAGGTVVQARLNGTVFAQIAVTALADGITYVILIP